MTLPVMMSLAALLRTLRARRLVPGDARGLRNAG